MSSPITPTENSTGALAVLNFITEKMDALGFERAEDPVVNQGQSIEKRSIIDRSWQFVEFSFAKNAPISGQTDRMDNVVILVNYLHRGNPWPAMKDALIDSDRIQEEFLNTWEDANVQTGGNVRIDGDHLQLLLNWSFPAEWVHNDEMEF